MAMRMLMTISMIALAGAGAGAAEADCPHTDGCGARVASDISLVQVVRPKVHHHQHEASMEETEAMDDSDDGRDDYRDFDRDDEEAQAVDDRDFDRDDVRRNDKSTSGDDIAPFAGVEGGAQALDVKATVDGAIKDTLAQDVKNLFTESARKHHEKLTQSLNAQITTEMEKISTKVTKEVLEAPKKFEDIIKNIVTDLVDESLKEQVAKEVAAPETSKLVVKETNKIVDPLVKKAMPKAEEKRIAKLMIETNHDAEFMANLQNKEQEKTNVEKISTELRAKVKAETAEAKLKTLVESEAKKFKAQEYHAAIAALAKKFSSAENVDQSAADVVKMEISTNVPAPPTTAGPKLLF